MKHNNWAIRLIGYNTIILIGVTVMVYSFHANGIFKGPPRNDIGPSIGPQMTEMMRFANVLARDIAMLILTVSFSVTLKFSEKWFKIEQERAEIEVEQKREELNNLKSQLNPHFLFNTLNSIYALIEISPDKAKSAVHKLSRLLRYVLYENAQFVKLGDELEFIDNYIKLMRLRLGSNMQVNVTLDAGDNPNRPIAPLLFISPVENAFKHGNTGCPDDKIDISITCINDVINCHIYNKFIIHPEASNDSGIGESNLRRRLELIYGKNATLKIDKTGNEYTVDMTINL
ncbi:MAG: histidine kinase [Muribaculaceae bacterium]|nr:histidine kinase [Muribaculaceae bacterium]